MNFHSALLCVAAAFLVSSAAPASPLVLTGRLHHLRAGAEREWDNFPQHAEGPRLILPFQARPNPAEVTLRLRQQDVRQTWKVMLNGKELARLPPDENDMVLFLPIPAGRLVNGDNTLAIEQLGRIPDDVRIGEITLDERPVAVALAEATVDIAVEEVHPSGNPTAVPSRITILNAQRALMTVGATSGGHLAVRPGVVYTATGRAHFGLPAGEYTIYAGRGFAYAIDSVQVTVRPGDVLRKTLSLRREVPTPGYVSCDTHIHTLTYSGHGDSSMNERMLTLAGEGIELPIATDHNRQIDYQAVAVRRGVRRFFTPVVGNEVTTAVGHFNIFPVPAEGPLPDYRLKDWLSLFASIRQQTAAPVVILNHPRDRHSGFRPFGPEHFNAVAGEDLDGWVLRANAMEVVNSGAQQNDVLRPFHDWMALLNRGVILTPVGSSDSHDVSRYLVGQGRTYIRCKNDRPDAIDVPEAVANFLKGRVLVSCGLLAEITVNDKYGPGDLVPAAGAVKVAVRVLGPSWSRAEKVALYANGHKIREAAIPAGKSGGVQWSGEWRLPRFRHDVHLTVIATGPGVRDLFWPIALPYQATSHRPDRHVVGATGAVWLDADGDGKWTSAYAYAKRLVHAMSGDLPKLVQALAEYDEAVAAQVACLLQARGVSVQDLAVRAAARKAGGQVERGFQAYAEAWRECLIARRQSR